MTTKHDEAYPLALAAVFETEEIASDNDNELFLAFNKDGDKSSLVIGGNITQDAIDKLKGLLDQIPIGLGVHRHGINGWQQLTADPDPVH